MKNNTFLALLCLLGVCLWAGSPAWGEGSPDFRQKLDEFIAIALEQNPGLHEAQNRINVFKEITPQAGSLDDPMLQFGLMNLPVDTLAFDQADMTQKQITLSQKLPFPGKLGLREGIAAKSTAVSEQSYEGLKLELIRQIRVIYDNFGFETKVLAASIRHPKHVVECALVGCDVVTVPFNVIQQFMKHPLTDNGLEKFIADYKKAFG